LINGSPKWPSKKVHLAFGGQEFLKRWEELGGEALIETYNPDEAGILYLLKTMNRDGG
jgi:hypothetical protein